MTAPTLARVLRRADPGARVLRRPEARAHLIRTRTDNPPTGTRRTHQKDTP